MLLGPPVFNWCFHLLRISIHSVAPKDLHHKALIVSVSHRFCFILVVIIIYMFFHNECH